MTTHATQQSRGGVAGRRPWTSWTDWGLVILGGYLALAPLWTAGAPLAWFIVLGAAIVIVGLWALTLVSYRVAEWLAIALGALTFLLPWMAGFAANALAGWTAWILGAVVAVLGVLALGRET